MDVRRVRVWEWLTALAGAVVLASLFLPWYGRGEETATGWESLTVVDVVLAVAALVALALPVVAAIQRTAAVPQSWTALVMLVGVVAGVLAFIRLLDVPGGGPGVGREAGVWIGTAAMLALLWLDARSMGDKRFPRAMRPRLDIATIPAPTADGERRDVS
jgi:hypothetical protein